MQILHIPIAHKGTILAGLSGTYSEKVVLESQMLTAM